MKPDPANGTPLTGEAIARTLADAILEHRLAPGTKLGEDEVGEIFGVSRTIVRAALHALAHDELVQLERHRGAFVARPSLREAREVFEARRLIEPATARAAAGRMRSRDRARLRRHLAAEHAALEESDHGRAVRLSGAFHVEVARIADQQTILRMVETLVARSSLIVALYWRQASALCGSTAHHALVDALAAADADRAEALMLEHLGEVLAALDLRERPEPPRGLRDAIAP